MLHTRINITHPYQHYTPVSTLHTCVNITRLYRHYTPVSTLHTCRHYTPVLTLHISHLCQHFMLHISGTFSSSEVGQHTGIFSHYKLYCISGICSHYKLYCRHVFICNITYWCIFYITELYSPYISNAYTNYPTPFHRSYRYAIGTV